jgi:APA family basic amino acid/polyamine antiporter
MWGYPVVPALFIAAAAGLLGYTFWNDRPNSYYGVLVILAGIPVFSYFSFLRRGRA